LSAIDPIVLLCIPAIPIFLSIILKFSSVAFFWHLNTAEFIAKAFYSLILFQLLTISIDTYLENQLYFL